VSRLQELIPATEGGASRFGLSFIKSWACPYEGAMQHLAPHPNGGRGLTPQYKARPLLAGGLFHAAVEPWYISRCINKSTGRWTEDTGVPDMDRVWHELDVWAAKHTPEWEDPVERDTDIQLVKSYVQRYHDWYGPTGTNPEFPNTRVYVDEDGPWVEREVIVPIAPGLEYTCRIDLVASDLGHPVIIEHKTSAASGFFNTMKMMHIGAQPTGELFALQYAKRLPFTPVACIANVINKNPGKSKDAKTPPFGRERVSRTEEQMRLFPLNMAKWLGQIEAWLEEYQGLLGQGVPPYEAIACVFPRTGTVTNTCFRYNRACDFWALCANAGNEERSAFIYNARYRDAADAVVPPSLGYYEEDLG